MRVVKDRNSIHRIAIFASGSGTNAENIVKHFNGKNIVEVGAIFSNKPNAYVLKRAEKMGIPSFVFSKEEFYHSDKVLNELKKLDIDLIVLAGFLWLIPDNVLQSFPNRIINIHPALLPKYGGKGMYGRYVHEAVCKNKEKTSGITIHYVNEEYDEGQIVFQAKCAITSSDTPDDVAEKVHRLEYAYYPKVIEKLLLGEEIVFKE